MQTIKITIDESGNPEVDLDGFHGNGCHSIQEGFAKAVGKAENVRRKPEFNRPLKGTTKLTNTCQ